VRRGAEGRFMTHCGSSACLRFQSEGEVRRVSGTATARPFSPQNGSKRDTPLGGPIVFDSWLIGCCLQLKVVEVERFMLGCVAAIPGPDNDLAGRCVKTR
jgi:hypothetical protein